MRFVFGLLWCLGSLALAVAGGLNLPGLPDKIYGVNLGSWLLLEPWMLPAEWVAMGGERCSDCSTCIASEFEFVKAYGAKADKRFDEHWSRWFTQADVKKLVRYGINTVRIPLGYWLVEPLVDRRTEFYPRGGLKQLKRGLRLLKSAGIAVILDHHALPGVQAVNQMFAGRCTSDVQFYTPYNYHRALVWTAVMTAFSHIDRDFSDVASIQAVNEPIMDANLTPGYGQFQKDFVGVIRAVEDGLGIWGRYSDNSRKPSSTSVNSLFQGFSESPDFTDGVRKAIQAALPMISNLGLAGEVDLTRTSTRRPLVTNFMDINWQFNNPANPADAEDGPQAYDNHLYYSFGGVADPNPEAYLTHICNLDRIEKDAELGNSPLWFGEWGLPTQFNATDEFLVKWADAQKLAYSKDAGWIFWNFKIEISTAAADLARQWSYFEGVERGYLTKDPRKLHDPRVCDGYVNPD